MVDGLSMSKRWRISKAGWLAPVWLTLVVWGAGQGFGQGGSEHGGPPPALVAVGQVRVEDLQGRWEVVGRLEEVRRAQVAAEQAGRVVEVTVEEGQPVTGGKTVLVRIDDIWARLSLTEARAKRQQAVAAVAEAQALLELASRDRVYLEELFQSGSAKPKERDDAVTNEETARARLERAKADLAAAEAEVDRRSQEIKRLSVVAPFDGVVLKKLVEVGQWVHQGDEVAEVLSRGAVDAVVDVPERFIGQVQLGLKVEVFVEAMGQEAMGEVTAIVPAASTAARTFPVKIRLDDQGGRLRAGMSVKAKIPTGQRQELLTVPRDAVHQWGNGMVVWVVTNGVGVPSPVRVLFGQQDRYAIEPARGGEGPPLAQGTQVVVEGAERLFPGRAVTFPAGSPAVEATESSPGPS